LARILSIHAHPDDAEILAGGTLALLSGLGHEITIVTMTAGDCGSAELGPTEIAAIRRGEAGEAAKSIGARYECAEFSDLAIFNCDGSRRRVTELIRRASPDVVITAAPVDYHCDHEATSVLVRDGCFGSSAPNYGTGADGAAAALGAIPHLYFMDPVGMPSTAEFVVNVKSVMERKRAMLGCHASQREWLRRQHRIDDYIETMENWTREHGSLVGIEFGEGFRRYAGHPFPQTPLLEGWLGGNVIVRG
jgi:LmbE family N-acetylglucosaminyl deacetylase